MTFHKSITILYSSDIKTSIDYFIEKLGFENKWEWESPVTFGGIAKDDVEIFFCLNGQGSPGTWLSIMVDDVDEYYERIKSTGARIISTPESMDWNMREMLVEAPDGHMIRFGHKIECD
jgi:catechol 2,3-dioxygenase-like lactoylglutathione lyase family enzyme